MGGWWLEGGGEGARRTSELLTRLGPGGEKLKEREKQTNRKNHLTKHDEQGGGPGEHLPPIPVGAEIHKEVCDEMALSRDRCDGPWAENGTRAKKRRKTRGSRSTGRLPRGEMGGGGRVTLATQAKGTGAIKRPTDSERKD